jgi:uncharacterized protein YndB with AHSA1/START domain
VPGQAITAERSIRAPREALFAFLADLENHWLLADRFIEVIDLYRGGDDPGAQGGRVRMRGPLGMHAVAVTRVVESRPPERIGGTAELGQATLAHVHWTLRPNGPGTHVRLAASVARASARDRMLLAIGGRVLIRRRFANILETLERRVARQMT